MRTPIYLNKEAEEYSKYIDEVESELINNSDRGIVLVCASVIEELLGKLIRKVLKDSPTIEKDLFKGNAPLSNFDAKLKLSFYLGLITEEEMKNITIIQRIRNKFAHQVIDISLNKNIDIKNLTSNFHLAENSYFPAFFSKNISIKNLNPISKKTLPKDKFIYIFKHLNTSLYYRKVLYREIFKNREVLITKPVSELALLIYEQAEKSNKIIIEQQFDLIKIRENQYKSIENDGNSEEKLNLEKKIIQLKKNLEIFQANPRVNLLKNNYEFIKNLYPKI